MKKLVTTIALIISTVCCMQAQPESRMNKFASAANDKPGGWDFSIVSINSNSRAHQRRFPYPNTLAFGIGWTAGVNQHGTNIDMGSSYEIELSNIICSTTRLGNRTFATIGLGIDWRNYRMTGRQMFSKTPDGTIEVVPYPDGADPKFSRMKTFNLVVPLHFHIALSRYCYMSFGPELYYATYASLKTRYTIDGEKQKLKAKDLHNNKLTVGIGADLFFDYFGIYYKYNPCNVFKTDFGPEFNTMTVGIKIGI